MNSKYIYHKLTAETYMTDGGQVADLGIETNRSPYSIIEVVSCLTSIQSDIPGLVVNANIIASNYYSSDSTGTTICALEQGLYNTATHFNYSLMQNEQPKIQMQNTRYINLKIMDLKGNLLAIDPATDFFVVVFKISYPDQGSIQADYRKQILTNSL